MNKALGKICLLLLVKRLSLNLSKLWEMVKDKEVWHAAVYGVTKVSD